MEKILEVIIGVVSALLAIVILGLLNRKRNKKTITNNINIVNKVQKDFLLKNKDNIAFVFDGLQNANSIYQMLYQSDWIEKGNKVNFYVIEKKNFNLFGLEENNSSKVTCVLKSDLNKNRFIQKKDFEYAGATYANIEENSTIIYSSVERNIDNYEIEPYTSEIYGVEKEIIDKESYIEFLKELKRASNKKNFYTVLYQYNGIEIEVIEKESKDIQNISEILEFITNAEQTLPITESMIKELKVSQGLEELLFNVYCNYHHRRFHPIHKIKRIELLGEKFAKSLHDFSEQIENSCGKLLYAFELNAPDEIMEKINPCGDDWGTNVIVFENYILLFHHVTYE